MSEVLWAEETVFLGQCHAPTMTVPHRIASLPEAPLCSTYSPLSCLPSPVPGNHWCFWMYPVLPSPKSHIVGIIYIAFSEWPLSLSNIHLMSLRVFCVLIAHLLNHWKSLIFHSMNVSQFVYQFTIFKKHLGFFKFWAIVNKASVNIYVQVFGHVFNSSG